MLDLVGYLRRLGVDHPGPPTAESLAALHRAQVERIAYNTIDIHLGRRTTVDPYDSAARIVATGRGGYCFHLNGALSVVLGALGFDVRWHRGGVTSGPEEVPLRPFANHLALSVHGLPTSDNPGGSWFVDAGLGDALHAPLALRSGEARQGPFGYRLAASPVLAGGWRFEHDPAGSFRTMDFEPRLATADDFARSHTRLSRSPDSPFLRYLSIQRRDAAGVDKLLSRTLRRVESPETVTEREIESSAEWFAVLADVFGLTLDDVDAEGKERLWSRACAAHDEWKRSQDTSDERA